MRSLIMAIGDHLRSFSFGAIERTICPERSGLLELPLKFIRL